MKCFVYIIDGTQTNGAQNCKSPTSKLVVLCRQGKYCKYEQDGRMRMRSFRPNNQSIGQLDYQK